MSRFQERYEKEIVPELKKKFQYKNRFEVPKVKKVAINVGIGEASSDPKLLESVIAELALITGQKPVVTRARKSIAGFKLRMGAVVGCRVTLRRKKMYEFLDRLLNVALPRIRDFRGVSSDAFDREGNYTLGIREQIIFPEIEYDKVYKTQGMNITIVTNSSNIEEGRELLRLLGMPFRNEKEQRGR